MTKLNGLKEAVDRSVTLRADRHANEAPKITVGVLVEGGVVQWARASVPVDFLLFDNDNYEDDDTTDAELEEMNETLRTINALPEVVF
jgi:hypothetical protein